MAEITLAAYQDLRDYIQSNWQYIELQDDSNTPIIRISPEDSRVTWTHFADSQTLQLQVIIKGSDPDIALPSTFAKSIIFNVSNGGNPLSEESFDPFTMIQEEDQLTVVHSIEVPKL